MFPDLRAESATALSALDLPGYAIGGLCLGEDKEETLAMIDVSVAQLPDDRPRYLMGAGTPEDFLLATQRGIDLFDCVVPTRLARNGHCLTWSGRISLKQAQYKLDSQPIDANCRCLCCQRYSRAYLRHLFMAGEILVSRLATIHNVTFYQDFLSAIRSAITSGQLVSFSGRFLAEGGRGAIPVPENQES
jgi:queuine tRNA-ribosyltransferase